MLKMKTIVLLNVFVETDIFFQDSLVNRKLLLSFLSLLINLMCLKVLISYKKRL